MRVRAVLPFVALIATACRSLGGANGDGSVVEAERRRWVLELPDATPTAPSREQSANLRLSTFGLDPAELEALRPRAGPPVFMRVEPGRGLTVVRCEGHAPVALRFEPEAPLRQDWTWSSVELAANTGGVALADGEEVELRVIPSGSYWLARSHIPELRRARCGEATHVVAVFRVGQLSWSGRELTGCALDPSAVDAPSECDWPWTLELVALDHHAPVRPVCPRETQWTGRYCRASDRPSQDQGTFAYCSAGISTVVAECDPRWPTTTSWDATAIGVPSRLDDAELARIFDELAPALSACMPAPRPSTLELQLVGASGAVSHAEFVGASSRAEIDCLANALAEARFTTFASEHQTIRWPL